MAGKLLPGGARAAGQGFGLSNGVTEERNCIIRLSVSNQNGAPQRHRGGRDKQSEELHQEPTVRLPPTNLFSMHQRYRPSHRQTHRCHFPLNACESRQLLIIGRLVLMLVLSSLRIVHERLT